MQSRTYICYYYDLRSINARLQTPIKAEDRRQAIKIARSYVRELNLNACRKYFYFDSVCLLKWSNGKDSD